MSSSVRDTSEASLKKKLKLYVLYSNFKVKWLKDPNLKG